MNEELKRKVAEWAGFVRLQTNSGWFWIYPDGETQNVQLPNFPESLDACFEHLVPKAIDIIMAKDGYSSDFAYSIFFESWLSE